MTWVFCLVFFRFYESTVWKSCIIFSSWENDCGFSCSLAAWEFLIYYQSVVLVLAHTDALFLARLFAFSSLLMCLNNKSIFIFTVQLITTRTVLIHCHRSYNSDPDSNKNASTLWLDGTLHPWHTSTILFTSSVLPGSALVHCVFLLCHTCKCTIVFFNFPVP